MHLLNKEFDRVVCINLAERKDKKEAMQKSFGRLGIDVEWFNPVRYEFLPNIVNSINASGKAQFNPKQPFEIGASLSHYHVIKKALIDGVKKLFVFEDDAKFHKDFNNKLDNYWGYVPVDWDMISFYSFMYQLLPQNIRVSKRWMTSYKSWSLIAYGMNVKAMTEYIRKQDEYFGIADMVTFQMQETGKFNMYSAVPALCIPETDLKSDIRGMQMNYKNTPTVTNVGYSEENYE